MRIPEASVNAGGYYDENAPWQNGVVMDGAGAAGDAHAPHVYAQRPPHVPQPGYMVPPGGTFYPGYGGAPPAPPDDFSDYMWMENEEEFDKQVMQQLEEEALMEQCIEAMLEDERERLNAPAASSNGVSSISLEDQISKSTLNPLAAEFVPTRSAADLEPASVKNTVPVEVSANDNVSETKLATPELSAQTDPADAQVKPKQESKKEETPKADAKKLEPKKEKSKVEKPKSEAKTAKSETKVKEVKTDVRPAKEARPAKTKSDAKIAPKKEAKEISKEEGTERRSSDTPVVSAPAVAAKMIPTVSAECLTQPTPAVSASTPASVPVVSANAPVTAPVSSNPTSSAPVVSANATPKPINYAAAARANKPRKPADQ